MAVTIWTVPRVVSRKEPVGIWRASVSGTNVSPFWLAPARAAAVPAGTAISTGPLPGTGPMLTSSPTVGGGRSSIFFGATVNEDVCAAPTLPAASRARTEKVWGPAGSGGVVKGEEQGAKGAPSMLHSRVEPASFAPNSNVGVSSSVEPEGPATMVVSGGVVSGGGAVACWDVTGAGSDVVDTLIVHGPELEGFVMLLKVIRTLRLAAMAWPPNSAHLITRPLGLPQLPTVVPLVTSTTAPPV